MHALHIVEMPCNIWFMYQAQASMVKQLVMVHQFTYVLAGGGTHGRETLPVCQIWQ